MIPFAEIEGHCFDTLASGGYAVEVRELTSVGQVLIAETAYALVMGIRIPADAPPDFVEDAQAELTRLAATRPSARIWDLYLLLIVDASDTHGTALRERYEHDVRYCRKLVVSGNQERVQQLLRPLLPLAPLPELAVDDPLSSVRSHLLCAQVPADVVERSIRSFELTGEVEIA